MKTKYIVGSYLIIINERITHNLGFQFRFICMPQINQRLCFNSTFSYSLPAALSLQPYDHKSLSSLWCVLLSPCRNSLPCDTSQNLYNNINNSQNSQLHLSLTRGIANLTCSPGPHSLMIRQNKRPNKLLNKPLQGLYVLAVLRDYI